MKLENCQTPDSALDAGVQGPELPRLSKYSHPLADDSRLLCARPTLPAAPLRAPPTSWGQT